MNNGLFAFRTAYLQALADAWCSEDKKNEMLDSSDLLEYLCQNYNLTSSYPLLNIKVSDQGKSKWRPVEAGGWTGECDKLVLRIPKRPEGSKEDWPKNLTKFYSLFPTCLGFSSKSNESIPSSNVAYSGAISNDLGISDSSFIDFGNVILRMVAIYWSNDELYEKINSSWDNQEDVKKLIEEYMVYVSPWSFNILIEPVDFIHFDHDYGHYSKDSKEIETKITLWYPNRPEELDKGVSTTKDRLDELSPVALAEYHCNGASHPFTCS